MGKRRIGDGHPCLIVAEVAQAHDGSLGMAHAFIDAAAAAGADAVKFQTHIAAAESTLAESWRVQFSRQDATRYDYWKRMEFTRDQWRDLAQRARKQGLIFLSSPFSPEAVDLLIQVGVPAWKIASGEIGDSPLLERVIQTRLPVFLSTGMSPLNEIDIAVKRVQTQGSPMVVLQCTTAYPCSPEKVGINLIPFFRQRYGCPVGLSDHSGTLYAGLAAAVLGIVVLEVHITLSREMLGPDVTASVTTEELRRLVEGVRFIERMRESPVDKDILAKEMLPLRHLFTKSVVAQTDLPMGTIISPEHLTVKKPGSGIPAASLHHLVGRRLKQAVKADQILQEEDFEE